MNKIVEQNDSIDDQDWRVLWKNTGLLEKWLEVIDRDSGTTFWPNFIIDVYPDDNTPLTEVTFGNIRDPEKGYQPGETYQTQKLRILEIDDTGQWTDVEIIHTSQIYTIVKSPWRDCHKNMIPARDINCPLILRNPTFLDVYDSFKETSKGLTITEIGNSTGLSRNTVFRVCKVFVFHQWIRREKDKSYTVIEPKEFKRAGIKSYEPQ